MCSTILRATARQCQPGAPRSIQTEERCDIQPCLPVKSAHHGQGEGSICSERNWCVSPLLSRLWPLSYLTSRFCKHFLRTPRPASLSEGMGGGGYLQITEKYRNPTLQGPFQPHA